MHSSKYCVAKTEEKDKENIWRKKNEQVSRQVSVSFSYSFKDSRKKYRNVANDDDDDDGDNKKMIKRKFIPCISFY